MKRIVIVGEGPKLGSRAEEILSRLMGEAGLDYDKTVYVPAVDIDLPYGKKPTKTQIRNARPDLEAELDRLNPKFVILLGNIPLMAVLEQSGITKLRGKPVEKNGRVILPCLHPSIALHDEKHEVTIVRDLRTMKECVDFKGIPEERALNHTIVDSWPLVKKMIADLTGTVSVDLECTRLYAFETVLDRLVRRGQASVRQIREHKEVHNGNQPRVISIQLGTAANQWIVPAETAGIWTKAELKLIVRKLTKALDDCFTVYHNGKFDIIWMKVRFDVWWRVDFDTMLAHFLLDENDQHGLKYLAQKYFGVPDWDIGGKEKTTWSPTNAKYGAHDIFYTRKLRFLFGKMLNEDLHVRRVFRKILMPCTALFAKAEYHGVYIDQTKFEAAEEFLREEVRAAAERMEPWAAKAELVDKKTKKINWGSGDQLAHLLFEVLEIEPLDKTEGGKNSTSESVLLRIDHPMVGDLLKWRGASKQLSSFIEGWKPYLDVDGRLHPSFKLHGTVTGRLSCVHPNLQQVPRDPRIRTLVSAQPGYVLIEMDLSQIELRIAAELSGEANMLQAFFDEIDVHWLTAIREIERGGGYAEEVVDTVYMASQQKMTYTEAIEELLKMGPDLATELWKGWKELRKKAKAINFGYLYGMWWRKFKLYARDNYGVDVTDKQAKASRVAFFDLYPGFPQWHDRQRRFANVNGYVSSLSGRKRRLPAAQSHVDSPKRREAERQAINSPVQSFANELNLMAALEMADKFDPELCSLVGTVHDAVLMEVREDYVEHVYNTGLAIMASPRLLDTFEIELEVPILAEAAIGPWSAGVKLDKWLKANRHIEQLTRLAA